MTIHVMMPFWGDIELFKKAVLSVLTQSDRDWKLTVIDDRYPGVEHRDWLEAIDDDRVSYVVNDHNLGVAANFQRSIDLATEDLVVIMGCDDLLLPNYVARIHALAARYPEASYFQPGVRVIDESGRPYFGLVERVKEYYRPTRRRIHELSGPVLAISLLRGNWTYFPSLCWRRADLSRWGFRPEFRVVLDLALQLDIATANGTLVVDDVDTFLYRRHKSSVSSAAAVDGSRFAEERAFFIEAARRCSSLGWRRAARVARAHLSSRLNAVTRLPSALAKGDRRGARALVAHALRP